MLNISKPGLILMFVALAAVPFWLKGLGCRSAETRVTRQVIACYRDALQCVAY